MLVIAIVAPLFRRGVDESTGGRFPLFGGWADRQKKVLLLVWSRASSKEAVSATVKDVSSEGGQ